MLTYLHIVLGEMVPKALALQRADKTALYVSPLIRALQRIMLPLVVVLNGVGNRLLRLAGIERREVERERYHTAEELEFIVRESHEGGLLRGESGQILRDLFEFGDRTAGEVMVPRVLLAGIPVGAEPDELRAIVRTHAHTRYPVYSGDLDNIIGSLHIKEILRHLISNQPVAARDARALPYVPGPAPLDEVLAAMRRFRAQMAVVMDQHGGTAGLVTIEDLFEEVVGEIDEGRARRPIVPEVDGRVRVRGTVRLDEAGEALGRSLGHDKVTTISGLVLLLLMRPASAGDVVTCTATSGSRWSRPPGGEWARPCFQWPGRLRSGLGEPWALAAGSSRYRDYSCRTLRRSVARSCSRLHSSGSTGRSTFSSDVTPRSEIPQGTINLKWSRSVRTLKANPWLVIQREIRIPIAPIFSAPTQVPVSPATRPADTP